MKDYCEDYCEDCGCKMYDGICPNCQEELYILTTQSDDIHFKLSDEFLKDCERQAEEVLNKKR